MRNLILLLLIVSCGKNSPTIKNGSSNVVGETYTAAKFELCNTVAHNQSECVQKASSCVVGCNNDECKSDCENEKVSCLSMSSCESECAERYSELGYKVDCLSKCDCSDVLN